MSSCCNAYTFVILIIALIVLLSLYTSPNLPNLSIEEFSVPAFNKTSNETIGDIYFDLKLRNMNMAIGLYYEDPSSLAFSYYPLQEPYQKYVWECTLPSFYQGYGKTKHIRILVGQPSIVVHEEDHDDRQHEPVKFTVNLTVYYRFKYWTKPDGKKLEVGADVMVDAKTGKRVSKGSIKLVNNDDNGAKDDVLAAVLDLVADYEPGEEDSKRKSMTNKKSHVTKDGVRKFMEHDRN